MNKIYILLAVAIILIAAFFGLAWQYNVVSQLKIKTDTRITVAATIFPLADIVKNIAGDRMNVVLIVPPGISEHTNSLNPQQLQKLQSVRAIFAISHGLDDRLAERITQALPSTNPITVDRGIQLRQFSKELDGNNSSPIHSDSGTDPHYWLTVPNTTTIAATITDKLVEIDPANTDYYHSNLTVYQAKLSDLEKELQDTVKTVARKQFITMHNAWSYFADQYGLQLVATYEPVEGQSPSLNDLERIKAIIRQYGITTFYAEPQKQSPAVTNFMQNEFGLKISNLDPIGGTKGINSYVDLMRSNMQAIVNGSQ